ncbi:STAS domain-containing protein [Vibrio methylphosphonaticus]|uniref:STAS domain-containing protein n=1 Tax=Vibrio methylphosphonaticus TaxID=2946866 RepID=UPI00202A76C1|nr:STAS domain-containing protein [Vibrio methylphosphonaticus]MCL9774767.1 STAS domain-containing protein [Vibrio methylphosphonaticus]
MAFFLYSNDSLTVIEVKTNRFDAKMIPHFRQYLNQFEQLASQKLLIDLTGVIFMDSSALGTIMALHKTYDFGEMSIISQSPSVLNLFKLTKVDQLLNIYRDIDHAVEDMT